MQRLCQIALAAQKKEKKMAPATSQQQAARRPKEHNFRSGRERDREGLGSRGHSLLTEKEAVLKQGVLPFPVLLHLQNIQLSLAAPYSWEVCVCVCVRARASRPYLG